MVGFATVVGFIGNAFGLVLMATPLKEVLDLTRNGGAGGDGERALGSASRPVNNLIYIAMFVNYIIWTLFGWLLPDPFIWVPNLAGTILSTFYLYRLSITRIFDANQRSQSLMAFVLTVLVVITLYYADSQGHITPSSIGFLGAILSILMYGSPLAALKEVIETKSTSNLSLPLSVVILCVTTAWTTYGSLVGNSFVFVPNAIGLCLAIAQVSLFGIYPRTNKPVIISV